MIGGVSNNTSLFQTQFNKNQKAKNEVLSHLATGQRINRGADDPAGLIVASRLQSEIAALEAESRAIERLDANANIVDGHLAQAATLTGDVRKHLLAAANEGGLVEGELDAHQLQIDHTVDRVQSFTRDAVRSLDGIRLPDDGNAALAQQLEDAATAVGSLRTGGANALVTGNFEQAGKAAAHASTAFAEGRGIVGSYQRHTLEARANAAAIERENLMSAHSQIMDADFAAEAANLARANVQTAASGHVLRIANQNAKTVLSLLA